MTARIPWWTPAMTGGEMDALREVIQSNYLNDGAITSRFEDAIARRVGAKHAVAFTSGTIAIFGALVAAGVGPGDEVIVPDLTFIATANAVSLAGARTILVDVDPRTLTMDVAAAERAITARTRAIMPVHVSGRGADMSGICALAARRGVAVIEDAAEALTSRQRGRALGTIGSAGCLSFSPNKSITTGQGGMVLTDDDALAGRLRALKDQGRSSPGTGGDDVHETLGFNFKFTNLQAAVGLAQLERLDERTARQRAIRRRYGERLADAPGLTLLPFDLEGGEVPLWTDALVDRRDDLDRHLRERSIDCRRFWHPLHTQAPYRRGGEDLAHATRESARALWLPSAFTLSDADVDTVCDEIAGFLGR